MNPRSYQICTNCVMDTSDAMISFDEAGVCDHCRNFWTSIRPVWDTGERGRAELERVVEEIRRAGRGREHDCILGVSGGIDSSYLLYLAKEQLGLRPLVFHVDGGWNSGLAERNIERLVRSLGLDLLTVVIDWEEMRDLQLAFFKAGVPHIDTPQDHAFFATMYNFADKRGIRHILTGANYSTECIRNPLEWTYHATDLVQIRDIHSRFGTRPLKSFPTSNILRHKVYLRYVRGIRVVAPLNYVPYVKADAVRLLRERFGWEEYPQKHFESVFTRFFEGCWLPGKFGYDTRRVQFSSLILTGQMTRDEALDRLKRPPCDEESAAADFALVAEKLRIPPSELEGYFNAPNRTFRDYKSQERLFQAGTRILNALGLEKRSIR